MGTDIRDEIKAYTRQIECGAATCGRKTCPSCGQASQEFKRNDRRKRTFRVIVIDLVRRVSSFLLRWKCPLCGTRFTDYPSFALPHKQFVRQEVMKRCHDYVENNEHDGVKVPPGQKTGNRRRSTYRKVASMKDGRPIAYEGDEEESLDARAFSHSTLYRWVTRLGRQAAALTADTIQRISAVSSASKIHRLIPAIHPEKYRSETRRTILEDGFIFFRACDEYRIQVKEEYFPDFGTREANA